MDRIKAESRIQITELERRAVDRFIAEETKKQRNIEEIIRQALPQLHENAKPANIEDDWLTNFFDKCRLISDAEMQSLWSSILAGEANAHGSFSKRTINFISSLDKSDAQLFTNLCTFGWEINERVVPLIYDPEEEVHKRHGITSNSLMHLADIGLIHFDSMKSFSVSYKTETNLPVRHTVFYYEKPTHIELSGQSGWVLGLGLVSLTKVGQELARICGSTSNDEF